MSVDVSEDFGLKYSAGVLTADASGSRIRRSEHKGSVMIRSSSGVEAGISAPVADQTVFLQGWKTKRFVKTQFADTRLWVPSDEVLQVHLDV